MPQLGISILQFIALISTPPFHACAAAPLSLICVIWIENTLQAITSKLRFAWLQSPCCSLCCRLFFLISSLRRQRKKFPEGKKQRRIIGRNRGFFFFDLLSEIFHFIIVFLFVCLFSFQQEWQYPMSTWKEMFLLLSSSVLLMGGFLLLCYSVSLIDLLILYSWSSWLFFQVL